MRITSPRHDRFAPVPWLMKRAPVQRGKLGPYRETVTYRPPRHLKNEVTVEGIGDSQRAKQTLNRLYPLDFPPTNAAVISRTIRSVGTIRQ